MRNLLFGLLCGSFLFTCSAPDKSTELLVNADFEAIEVDLEDLFAAGQFPKDTLITIEHDEFFKQKKRYKVYPLAPILKPLLEKLEPFLGGRIVQGKSVGKIVEKGGNPDFSQPIRPGKTNISFF